MLRLVLYDSICIYMILQVFDLSLKIFQIMSICSKCGLNGTIVNSFVIEIDF